MKAITLTQPWATLVAIGAKRIETRSWKTDYRGPLAIHAAKGFPKFARDICMYKPFVCALMEHDYATGYVNSEIPMLLYPDEKPLPLGEIVATCQLVRVARIQHPPEKIQGWRWDGPDGKQYEFELSNDEIAFGNYSPGRYAWMLDDIQPLSDPIPAKGKLGLWEWNGATQ